MTISSANVTCFDQILEHLQQTRGFDVSAYKRTSLRRRVLERMQTIRVPTFEAYLDYLQAHQEECACLLHTILINVTSFFRDPDVWDAVGREVVPAIAARDTRPDGIHVWSAGCASGQEAYTVALVLAEALGVEAAGERVKIYATDLDGEALAEARAATYNLGQVADVPPAMLDKYFDRNRENYTVARDVRRLVIFGRHDLLQDAHISGIDLLICRNTLMYFNAEAQARILAKFYLSLNPNGYMLLGRAEMLFSQAAMFSPVDLKRRLFRRVPNPITAEQLGEALPATIAPLRQSENGRQRHTSHG